MTTAINVTYFTGIMVLLARIDKNNENSMRATEL